MTHYYKHKWQRFDFKRVGIIREIVARNTRLLANANPIDAPIYQRIIDEHKLEYQERTGRPYKAIDDFDNQQVKGGII